VRYGELFAGVSGLGMAVEEVFGASPAWFAEIDTAPSKVLAHHYPNVLNVGDVSAVDWTAPELQADILAGGFPCQDVSLAGKRKGMRSGTRSGLWAEFARAIEVVRPSWVVIENVRGLLSAGTDSDVEPCPWCVGVPAGEHALRALGAVLGDLAGLGFDAEWVSVRASDVGAPHGRFRVFILGWPVENAGHGFGRQAEPRAGGRDHAPVGPDRGGSGGGHDSRVTLLPTPVVNDMGDGKTVDHWDDWTARMKGKHGNGNGHGPSLAVEAARLLPTPGAYDGDRGGARTVEERKCGGHSVNLQDVAVHGVAATNWGPYAPAIQRWEDLLGRPAPAPVRYDGKGGKPRLNPALPEWMMGWPEGWVTAPEIGLTRAEQLKACGNGVVTMQAAAALQELVNRASVGIDVRRAG
jgi:DNA (cytosine-5)-methyltransferase 1